MARRYKYGVSPKEERTRDGIVFASKAEMTRYVVLKTYEKCGVISNLELQPRYNIDMNGVRCGFWKGDFRYQEKGREVIEDVKGHPTAIYRLKKKLIEAQHGIKITEVK